MWTGKATGKRLLPAEMMDPTLIRCCPRNPKHPQASPPLPFFPYWMHVNGGVVSPELFVAVY